LPDRFDTQYGQKILRAGNHKLKILEWMHSLLYLKDDSICGKFKEIQLPMKILKLISCYEMNSLLHLRIFKIFFDSIDMDTEIWVETVYLIYYHLYIVYN